MRLVFLLICVAFNSFAQNVATDTVTIANCNDSLFVTESYSYKLLHTEALTSYYGKKFNGRKTASGAIFNNKKFTAAHKTLPFGTKLRLTNPINGKQTEVIVNDRGPFTKGRKLDISKAAFMEITDHPGKGILKLNIEVVENLVTTINDSIP